MSSRVAYEDGAGVPLPLSVGSVVWSEGHPWVLDGEPESGEDLYARLWVGRRENDGAHDPACRSRRDMARSGFSVIWCSDGLTPAERAGGVS